MSEIRFTSSGNIGLALLSQVIAFEAEWDGEDSAAQTQRLAGDIIDRLRGYLTIEHYDGRAPLGIDQLNEVLDSFYLDLAFSSTTEDMPLSTLNSIAYLVRYHTGEALSMSIFLHHVLCTLGFDADVVAINQDLMVKVTLEPRQTVIVDPVFGEQFNHKPKAAGAVLPEYDEFDYRLLDEVSLLHIYLTQQKMAFTEELQFDKALQCIEMLMETMPDDPYQRRDRGFVLHQLDCFDHARSDFEYFIDQCPEDPAAQLLKLQLDELKGPSHTLH